MPHKLAKLSVKNTIDKNVQKRKNNGKEFAKKKIKKSRKLWGNKTPAGYTPVAYTPT